ncbi:equilibrative nucleobase transporter 1-like isoform X1 [Macrobrachium nipponense]|uniref:equilibrative nucleobase transporter 1-like isoform X1 n=1 Tax=Macrobrachium nipponense TaxID=159736 RepID=UPI0030C80C55
MAPLAIMKQPASLREMSRGHRWFVLLTGLIETSLWSGNIFGWASLVHIMKTQGVFRHLCPDEFLGGGNKTAVTSLSWNETADGGDAHGLEFTRGCRAQDEQFTLIGTVAIVMYTTPGILVGYGLHHLGQAFTRITASVLISLGFVLLSLTSEATPNYLWGGSILLSVGGNMIRVACFEFGNLFPKQRNTVMAIISGIYTISAALFMVMQSAFEAGYGWEAVCRLMAVGSCFIVMTTLFIPWHHIPHEDEAGSEKQSESQPKLVTKSDDTELKETGKLHDSTEKPANSHQTPLSKSLFSVSMALLQFWLFNNMLAVTIFGTYFNSWINKFSQSNEEAAYYSRMFGYANVLCVFTTPLPGLFIDLLSAYYKRGKTGVEEKMATVQAMIAPMMIISFTVAVQISCFFFFSPWAVYLGLFCLAINRPGCLGVGIPFMRSRFPADHFNRMIGIQGTVISLLSTLQYLHFTWTQSNYYTAIGTLVSLLALSFVQPLHLFDRKYLHRVLQTSSKAQKNEEA